MLAPAFLDRPIAHRGLHDQAAGRVENSRSAVRAALEAGYGIEIDIQMARCGTPMVFHDDTLDRLTDLSGPITAQDALTLARTHLTRTEETIPSLREILALTAGKVPLLIEIKDQSGRLGPVDGRLERAVCAALQPYRGPVALMSFNPQSMAACQEVAPDLPRGLTTERFQPQNWPGLSRARCDALSTIADFAPLGACFVSHDHRALSLPAIAALKRRAVPVLCWTVRSALEEGSARRIADNVTFEGYRPALETSQHD
ncbi:MAG: glycerophosphodiester phosphodiesterase family protein [Pseudomonadota bacterium]